MHRGRGARTGTRLASARHWVLEAAMTPTPCWSAGHPEGLGRTVRDGTVSPGHPALNQRPFWMKAEDVLWSWVSTALTFAMASLASATRSSSSSGCCRSSALSPLYVFSGEGDLGGGMERGMGQYGPLLLEAACWVSFSALGLSHLLPLQRAFEILIEQHLIKSHHLQYEAPVPTAGPAGTTW